MRKKLRYWPAVLFAISMLFHADIAIVAHKRLEDFFQVSLVVFGVVIVVLSTLELWFEYWFLGWCRGNDTADVRQFLVTYAKQKIQRWRQQAWDTAGRWEIQQSLREIGAYLHMMRIYAAWAWEPVWFVVLTIRQHWQDWPLIKRGGYGAIALCSILPWPGVRTPAVILCRATNSRIGLAIVSVGNVIRTTYLLYLLS